MASYVFDSTDETLMSIESGILELESIVKGSMVAMALGLGRIKMDRLYLDIAPSFKDYLKLQRINIKQSTAYGLAKAGENMHKHRQALEENNVRLSKVLQKMRYVNDTVADNDPLLWSRLIDLTDKSFQSYIKEQTARINGVIGDDNTVLGNPDIYTRGASLIISGKIIPGINLNEFHRKLGEGKRPLVFWVTNDRRTIGIIKSRMKSILYSE